MILFFWGCTPAAPPQSPGPNTVPDMMSATDADADSRTGPKRLTVIGVKNEIQHPDWDNQLIAYGISHILLQKLFEKGGYAPVEDNPEIIAEINRLIALQWEKNTLPTPEDADRAAARFYCEAVAYARLTDFFTTRKRGFAGPFSRAVTKITVELEVYVKETGKPVRVSTGTGTAETRSSGVFFQIRKDRIYFDETAVGQATQKAIENAVKGF